MKRVWRWGALSATFGVLVGRATVVMAQSPGQNPDPNKLIDPNATIQTNLIHIYNQSLGILLWIAILMLIVTGYIYITSMGSADKIKLAKDLLGTTLTGIILLLLIPLILRSFGYDVQ